ncbi:TonB-dependent receptor [Novosphingobium sp. SG720]|uniref:TonB-dependent receptor n=1 Tax=Novosphingobium sp. SG720 TaxID=2586998 RepID=UPI0014455C04|nr:TonB-dependent receptor [Novosphingobium sp. SG720]NKJ42683.1 iron complex outermembrane receptor protein [Novosphingobium sp. SG720]
MNSRHKTALLTGLSLAVMATPAFAQSATTAPQAADGSPDAAIVVTAQRRVEKVTEVPISITVADAGQLERQQVNTVNDLNRIAPSLEIQSAPGQNTGGGGAIRGIGTQTFSAGAVASVGVVVDQVSQGNANISDLFDVARIEVLKGPQGTLFGLTTSAGVINITTNKPEFGKVSVRVRSELSAAGFAGSKSGNQVVQGVANVPIADNAAIRVAGYANLRQGPDYNLSTGKYDKNETMGGRARLLWEPTDKLTVNVIGDYADTRTTNGGNFFTFVKSLSLGSALAACGITAENGNRNYCTSEQYTDRIKTGGASLQLDYQFAPFTLTSITAYRGTHEQGYGAATNVFRVDTLPVTVHNSYVNRPTDLITQELRISSPANQTVEYTLGGFYSRQIQHRDQEGATVLLFGNAIPSSPVNAYRVSDESLAAFGQMTIHASDKLRLIAGGRYTDDVLSLQMQNDTATAIESTTRLHVGKVSWKGGIQYDIDPRTMAYATVARGFKGGQIATPSDANPYVVLPEIPTSYELGFKTTLLRSWVLDANLFYQKIQNFQAQQCTVNATTTVISCVQTNISGVKSRGAEINLFGKVTHDLSLNTGFIWAKATYPTGYVGTDGTNIGDTQLAYAPEYKFTVSGEYARDLGENLKGFLAADAVWKSRLRYEANSVADTTFAPHWTVGGRIGLRTADDRFTIAVFARNLFDVHEPSLYQSDFPFGGAANIGAIYGPQSFRSVGLSLDGKF